jgi:DNA-binding CsgD family transcriptional regulator/tetratricopeptide (TPR) repeat protein
VAHYEQALRYAERLDARTRAILLDELAYEYQLTDRIPQALAALESGLSLWRELGERLKEGDTWRWLSRASWFAGRGEDARRYADAALGVLENLPPSPELAMAYSNRAQLEMLASRSDPAIDFAQRAIALAEQLGKPAILSHAMNNLGTARLLQGDASGWGDLERSLEIAHRCGREEPVARAHVNLGVRAVVERRLERAVKYISAGIAYCDDHDLASFRLYLVAWRARAHLEDGDWDQATEDADRAVRDPRTSPVTRIPALLVLGLLRLRRGDPDAASPLEEARRLIGPMQELQRTGPLAAALAEAAWLAEDKDTIVREVLPVYTQTIALRDGWLAGELAAWLYRSGALDVKPMAIAEPYELEILGDWRGAAKAWAALGCTYDEAMIHTLYGEPTERRAALATFERLGASAVAQYLRKVLRAQGVRDVPRGAHETTRSNEFGLTRREAQVLRLLSDGRTNAAIAKRLFLSTKTVEHHVSAVLGKLGVATRALAIAKVRKRSEENG